MKMLLAKKIIYPLCSIVFSFLLIFSFVDWPQFFHRPDQQHKMAAIAIRDTVPLFQAFGSRYFTMSYLNEHYDSVYYVTEYSPYEKKEVFLKELERMLNENDTVDVYLLAHSNSYVSWFLSGDLKNLHKIRLVYNTGCTDLSQAPYWMHLKVNAYVGHSGDYSQSPFFYIYFLRRWVNGMPLDQAVSQSNNGSDRLLSLFHYFIPIPLSGEDLIKQSRATISGQENLTIGREIL